MVTADARTGIFGQHLDTDIDLYAMRVSASGDRRVIEWGQEVREVVEDTLGAVAYGETSRHHHSDSGRKYRYNYPDRVAVTAMALIRDRRFNERTMCRVIAYRDVRHHEIEIGDCLFREYQSGVYERVRT